MLISKRIEFSASHRCWSPALSEEENFRVYGPAANPNGHGHNYILEVTISGDPDPVTGMIFDLKKLKDVLEEQIVQPMDHRHLNYEVAPFDRIVPTVENVAIEIWNRLEAPLQSENVRLHSVKLYESADLYAEYSGEAA